MRKSKLLISCLLFAIGSIFLTSCTSDNATTEADTYICPMHPTVVSNKQGVCPVCNMDLVRKARPGEEVKMTEELARLLKSPNESVVSSVKTIKGEYISQTETTDVTGLVTYDTRNLSTISARIGGRLENVTIKYPFQPVSKGQKIAEIYSAELVAAQRELLFLLTQEEDESLVEAAKSKLKLLGATDAQLSELIRTKEVQYKFSVLSPVNGYVVLDEQSAPAVPVPSAMGMQSSAVSVVQKETQNDLLREGDYVNAGATLFKVVNTQSVLVELLLTADQGKFLAVGDSVNLVLNNQRNVKVQVGFVQPFYNAGQEFLVVRMYVSDGSLKIGELVKANWSAMSNKLMWLPRQAIVDLGNEMVVFVKERGAFTARPVALLESSKTKVAVSGISSTDEIASDAQFMVDSEGFIRIKK